MKKFTRFFATVAAVSMVAASLAGCGSKSDNTASTDTTADSATAGDTLKIGGIGPEEQPYMDWLLKMQQSWQ